MKKTLLSVALVMAALSVNAQDYEFAAVDAASLTTSDGQTLTAGTEIASTASVTCTVRYDDTFKTAEMKTGTLSYNGTVLSINSAIQGNTNPSGTAATAGTYPSSGCIYRFTPNQDGYLYVFISASGNKPYVVFEEEDLRMPYIFAMENTNDASPATSVYAYDLSAIEGATYYDEEVGDYYVDPDYSILQVSQICEGQSVSTTGNGVIKFQVFADCRYDVLATGSKITLGGFAFDTTGDATITTDTNTLLEAGQVPGSETTGITDVTAEIAAAADVDAPAYNIAGQRVDKNAKGLVIINGKKVFNK